MHAPQSWEWNLLILEFDNEPYERFGSLLGSFLKLSSQESLCGTADLGIEIKVGRYRGSRFSICQGYTISELMSTGFWINLSFLPSSSTLVDLRTSVRLLQRERDRLHRSILSHSTLCIKLISERNQINRAYLDTISLDVIFLRCAKF